MSDGILRIALTAAGLAAALPASAGFSFLPGKVQAGKAFDMMLVGSDFSCATEFTHLKATVGKEPVSPDTSIFLDYHAKDNPAVRCGPRTQPMGPIYSLPALRAGEYPVFERLLDGCLIAPDPCIPYVVPKRVGTLTVTAAAPYDSGWFLEPAEMKEGTEAVLTLLNRDHSECQNGYANNTWAKVTDQNGNKGEYILQFETFFYKRNCQIQPSQLSPFGPSFRLGTVTPGRYPVKAYDLPSCAFEKSPCIPIVPWKPVLEDTLVVTASGSSRLQGQGRRAASRAATGAFLSRGILHVTPGYHGPWRDGRQDLNGRTLAPTLRKAAP